MRGQVWIKKSDFFRKVRLLTALLALALTALASAAPAQAHGGGTPQLVQAPSGPYQIYAWTNPEPPRAGLVHVTVALVDPATQQPVLDADVQIVATAGAGNPPVSAQATHDNAVIKTYYETDLDLPAASPWQITVTHSDVAGRGSADFTLDVQPAARNWRPIAIGAMLAVIAIGAWYILKKQ